MPAPPRSLVGVVSFVVAAAVSAVVLAAPPSQAQRVLVVGDSVPARIEELPAAAWALERGMSVQADVAVCRRLVETSCTAGGVQPPTALQVITTLRRVPPVVVLAVGYNDPPSRFASDAATVMRALTTRGVRHVVWVTLRESRPDWRSVNAVIRSLARRSPGVVSVADWNGLSTGKPWFDDEIHVNADGAVALATLIRSSVLAACGKGCLLPPRPPLQPLPVGHRICVERAGGEWAAVLGTARSARDALDVERRAVASGFGESLIVQSTPALWQIALFGFPTRAAAIGTYLEIKSHGFRESVVPNVDACGDEAGSWKAIFGRTTTAADARSLLERVRRSGFADGAHVDHDAPADYAVVVGGLQSTSQLPGFAHEALRAGYVVSFSPA